MLLWIIIQLLFSSSVQITHWPPYLNDDAIAPITSKYGLEKSFNKQLYPNHQVAVELTFFHGWVWPFTRKYSQLVANGRKMKHNTAPTEILFFIWHKRQTILGIQMWKISVSCITNIVFYLYPYKFLQFSYFINVSMRHRYKH